jgi:hypothetical protein
LTLYFIRQKRGDGRKWLTEDWGILTGLLPEGWREQAREQGMLRRTRKIKDPGQLLRYIL